MIKKLAQILLVIKCKYIKKYKIALSAKINKDTFFEGHNSVGKNSVLVDSFVGYASFVGSYCSLPSSRIGRYCSIANNVEVICHTHPSSIFVSTHPSFYSILKQSGFSYAKEQIFNENLVIESDGRNYHAYIGNDVWLGAHVLIMGGVKIGDGSIVAAGSVVTKDVPPYAIVGGVPAKLIRMRFSDEQIAVLINFKWWNMDSLWIENNYNKFLNIQSFIDG